MEFDGVAIEGLNSATLSQAIPNIEANRIYRIDLGVSHDAGPMAEALSPDAPSSIVADQPAAPYGLPVDPTGPTASPDVAPQAAEWGQKLQDLTSSSPTSLLHLEEADHGFTLSPAKLFWFFNPSDRLADFQLLA